MLVFGTASLLIHFAGMDFQFHEVADAYMQYIESMFTGEPVIANELNSLIKSVDEQKER